MFLIPVWLAVAACVAVIALACGTVYLRTRERFIAFWALAWLCGIPAGIVLEPSTTLSLRTIAVEACSIAYTYLVLRGNCEFLHRQEPRAARRAALAAVVWLVSSATLRVPFILGVLPAATFEGVALAVSARLFLTSSNAHPVGKALASLSFFALAGYFVANPLLLSNAIWAEFSHRSVYGLMLMGGMGIFVSYLDVREQESRVEEETRLRTEAALMASEARYRELTDLLPECVFEIDLEGNLTFGNSTGFRNFGYSPEDLGRGLNVLAMIAPEQLEEARNNLGRAFRGEPRTTSEYMVVRKDGSRFPVIIHGVPIVRDGQVTGLRGIIVDITDLKDAREQLTFLSMHDPLTGLYNRTYFEEKIRQARKTPHGAAVIVCDMDGLKLVNDTLGHNTGDRLLRVAARIITDVFRHSDIVARIGGDEFAVMMLDVLSGSNAGVVERACQRLQESIAGYNERHPELPLSVSVGYSVSETAADLDSLFKEADDHMYREKLHRSQSARNSIVQTMMKTLEVRDYATEHHAERLEKLVSDVGQALGFPSQQIADLRLLAQFHDIGKVGISDNTLFKPGPLTPKEREEINRHSEIGYRIARVAPDLAPIADWILKHHERWDGTGYPLGLKGDEIPLECRILAIADSFDAMTSERPYRRKLDAREAVREIQRCSGSQFDPRLVDIFVRQLAEFRETVAT